MDSDAILTAVNAVESITNPPHTPERSSYRARKTVEQIIHLIFLLCGIVAVAFVLLISIYLILSGLPAIRQIGLFQFLLGKVWDPTNTTTGARYGILPFIHSGIRYPPACSVTRRAASAVRQLFRKARRIKTRFFDIRFGNLRITGDRIFEINRAVCRNLAQSSAYALYKRASSAYEFRQRNKLTVSVWEVFASVFQKFDIGLERGGIDAPISFGIRIASVTPLVR